MYMLTAVNMPQEERPQNACMCRQQQTCPSSKLLASMYEKSLYKHVFWDFFLGHAFESMFFERIVQGMYYRASSLHALRKYHIKHVFFKIFMHAQNKNSSKTCLRLKRHTCFFRKRYRACIVMILGVLRNHQKKTTPIRCKCIGVVFACSYI